MANAGHQLITSFFSKAKKNDTAPADIAEKLSDPSADEDLSAETQVSVSVHS
jgi:hypothetical protein